MIYTYAGALGEIRRASASGGGTGLTTAFTLIPLPSGAQHISIEGRNYSTAVVAQVLFNPWLTVLKTADALATVTDYSAAAQDGNTNTDVVLSSLDTFANLDALYVASHVPISGLRADVDAANSNASVMSADYWNGTAWSALTITDGTASAGATWAQDGDITWTVPTDWASGRLKDLVATCGSAVPHAYAPIFWLRLKHSAALDSSTTLNSLMAISRWTDYAELVSGRVIELSCDLNREPGALGCIQAKTDAGTASLIVNVASHNERGFV